MSDSPNSELGCISGRYFCDTNNDNLDNSDAPEPGVEDVEVELLDAAGNLVATTTTAADGSYRFDDLPPGTYSVLFRDPDDVLSGKELVTPNVGSDDTIDSDANGDTTLSTIADIIVSAGEENADTDAGVRVLPASLGDRVFFDTNRNGIQDPGEAGVAGVTVTLTGGGADGVIGTADDTSEVRTTDANGNYLFVGLVPDTEYKVTFSNLPTGTEFTFQNNVTGPVGDAGDSDADRANGMTQIVTLAAGEENLTLDAGIVEQLGSISGRYFVDNAPGDQDEDCDGLDNDGEDTPGAASLSSAPVVGATVALLDTDGNVIATTTTGPNGEYEFTGVEAGDYRVRFDGDPDRPFTVQDAGDDTIDSDVDPDTGQTEIITLAAGENVTDVDAGLCELASLGDTVFLDADRDGIQDPGEPGVANVTVTLTGGGADGVIGTVDDTSAVQTTDGNGNYLFEGLDPGTEYKVTFSDLPAGTEFTLADQGGDDTVDSDADPANGMTGIYVLAAGEENLTADAGLVEQLGSLSGRYFCDTNDNDVDDGQTVDPGVEGVVVTLFDAAGNAVASTTTGAEGEYAFEGLLPGSYTVEFTDPDTVLAGKQLVAPNVGADDTVDSDAEGDTTLATIADIVVTAGEETADNDAGAEYTAALGDTVFFDADRDGIQDAGEAGVANVTVTLTGGGADGVIGTADDTSAVQTTDGNGNYLFEGLDPGTEYKLTFSGLPAGTEFTLPNQGGDDAVDSDADPANGMTGIYVLAPGEENLTADAGIVEQLGSLSGRYFMDGGPRFGTACDGLDNDFVRARFETAIVGATVVLLDGAGNVLASTTTDENGDYGFTGLDAGDYAVRFAPTDGMVFTDQDVGGDDTIDSDVDPDTGETGTISIAQGEDATDVDAGARLVCTPTLDICDIVEPEWIYKETKYDIFNTMPGFYPSDFMPGAPWLLVNTPNTKPADTNAIITISKWINGDPLDPDHLTSLQHAEVVADNRFAPVIFDFPAWLDAQDDVDTQSDPSQISSDDVHLNFFGGFRNDFAIGGTNADAFYGGDNTLPLGGLGGFGNDTFFGMEGNDLLAGGNGRDDLYGGDDDDTILGGNGGDLIDAGEGDDLVHGGNGSDVIIGGREPDLEAGESDDDCIEGGHGNDTITDLWGDNIIYGYQKEQASYLRYSDRVKDDDTITTGAGNDYIDGQHGDDVIDAGDGDNQVLGGTGNDRITTGEGNDKIDAGADNDRVRAGAGDDEVCAGDGDDVVLGQAGDDMIKGDAGNDRLFGNAGEDIILGGKDDDVIRGQRGDDVVAGNSGNDIIYGNGGHDKLWFGAGRDEGYGGGGDDIFAFDDDCGELMNLGRNYIGDFQQSFFGGVDTIDFKCVYNLTHMSVIALGANDVRMIGYADTRGDRDFNFRDDAKIFDVFVSGTNIGELDRGNEGVLMQDTSYDTEGAPVCLGRGVLIDLGTTDDVDVSWIVSGYDDFLS